MNKQSNAPAMAAGMALGAAAGAMAMWAAGQNSRQYKKMAKKAARTAEQAVMGLDRMMKDTRPVRNEKTPARLPAGQGGSAGIFVTKSMGQLFQGLAGSGSVGSHPALGLFTSMGVKPGLPRGSVDSSPS